MTLNGYAIGPLLKKTAREVGEDRVPAMAASAAYNFFFSIFPLILFLVPLMSLIGDESRLIGFLTSQLTSVLPAEQLEAVRPILDDLISADSKPGVMSAGVLLAAWSGSMIFGNLTSALNVAYDVDETRSWWKQQLIRLMMFGLGAVILIASSVVFLGGEDVANWIGRTVGLGDAAVSVWKVVQFPLALAGLALLAFTTYWVLPNVHQRRSHVAIAAVFTTFLWVVATLLFRVYIQHFPPNPAYGFIGAVIVMLGWMYYTMFVLLIGGELASELHHGTAAMAPNRGAIYLGRIVSSGGPGTISSERRH
jgi:membrane protein